MVQLHTVVRPQRYNARNAGMCGRTTGLKGIGYQRTAHRGSPACCGRRALCDSYVQNLAPGQDLLSGPRLNRAITYTATQAGYVSSRLTLEGRRQAMCVLNYLTSSEVSWSLVLDPETGTTCTNVTWHLPQLACVGAWQER
jgi:hypothetical protein